MDVASLNETLQELAMIISRPATTVLLTGLAISGCGSAPDVPNSALDQTTARSEDEGARSAAVPSGRWMLDAPDQSGCIDCPTPRFAVVGEYSVDSEPGAEDLRQSPVGYPIVMLPHELGLASSCASAPCRDLSAAVVVFAMFSHRAEAQRWRDAHARAGHVRQIELEQSQRSPLVVRVRRTAAGFSEDAVRQASGFPENTTPVCTLEEGHLEVIEDVDYDAGDVVRIPDGSPWIRLACGDGTAVFRASDTDFGLIVERDGHQVVETQYNGGVCGVRYYQRRVLREQGEVTREQHLETGRCFDQPSGDSWNACPGNTLAGCVDRAVTLLEERDDLRRAARVAAYACDWGSERACILSWTIDLERGVSAGSVLADATSHCRFGEAENPESETCAAVERLLRTTEPEQLTSESDSVRGSVAREGCLREIPGWCELLETSELCDLGGCG